MVNMMKALVFTAPHTFEYRDVPRPEPAPDEVLVEVKACAICGSDVHGSSGENGRRIPPLVMGHEASGTIAQLGEAVQSWAVGDRVTFQYQIGAFLLGLPDGLGGFDPALLGRLVFC